MTKRECVRCIRKHIAEMEDLSRLNRILNCVMKEYVKDSGGKDAVRKAGLAREKEAIHDMVDDIKSSHRITQIHALTYRMYERDQAERRGKRGGGSL